MPKSTDILPNTAQIATAGLFYIAWSELSKRLGSSTKPQAIVNDYVFIPNKPIIGKPEHYQDRRRYDNLCDFKKELDSKIKQIKGKTGAGKYPEEWKLDDEHRPMYTAIFYTQIGKINKQIDDLSISDYPQRTLVKEILAKIGRLFQSLDKRNNWFHPGRILTAQVYRSDNFEAMFFTDLAEWLSGRLPNASIKNPETEKQNRSF